MFVDKHLSPRQQALARAIGHLGGYWPPISAVARLLEELGELAEILTHRQHGDAHPTDEELADLWIITACLANQFCITLPDTRQENRGQRTVETEFSNLSLLLAHAGLIARIVNYYDGPKPPRAPQDWVPLGKAIKLFHDQLNNLAEYYKADLGAAIDLKIARTVVRDRGRFKQAFDPSVALSLEHFERIVTATSCIYAPSAKLWGSPEWDSQATLKDNVNYFKPYLIRFTKSAQAEGLDSFVVELSDQAAASSMPALASRFREFLQTLVEVDPAVNRSFRGPVDRPGWQFTFNGVRLFISVFSPVYLDSHPRHSPSGAFVVFQPETSFDHYSIGSAFPQSRKAKERIRSEFIAHNKWYPGNLIDERIEARLYILPRSEDDHENEWWH